MITCGADQPVVCDGRRRAGPRFVHDPVKRGWFWLDASNPHRPWPRCPWCDGELPAPDLTAEGMFTALRQADGADLIELFDRDGLDAG